MLCYIFHKMKLTFLEFVDKTKQYLLSLAPPLLGLFKKF